MEEKPYRRCKTLMVVFNVLFMLGGFTLVGLGIWVVVDYQSFSSAISSNVIFQYAAYIVIAVGSLVAIISFLGCCGAWKENKCLLVTFISLLVVFFLIEVAVIVLAFLFTSTFEPVLREASLATIALYSTDSSNPVTTSWDTLHTSFQCCGYNDGIDFTGSAYAQQTNGVNPWPESCCVRQSVGSTLFVDKDVCLNSPTVDAVNSNANTGCYSAISNLVTMYSGVVGGVTAGLMTIQLLAIVFACCVNANLRSNKVDQMWD